MGGTARVVVETGAGAAGGYCMLVFTGWDHGLQGDRAIKLKQNNVRYRLQVCARENKIRNEVPSGIFDKNTRDALMGFICLIPILDLTKQRSPDSDTDIAQLHTELQY